MVLVATAFVWPVAAHGDEPLSASAAAASLDGYWMVDARGHVHPFGNAPHLGEGLTGTVDMAATRTGSGYWLVTGDGTIVARGDAPDLGARPSLGPGESVVAIVGDPHSSGAWIFTSRGNVDARGGAPALGGTEGLVLNQPVIDASPTPDGRGYWLVALDGGVFSFGSAAFYGSMGGRHLNGPVVGMTPTPDGAGYWLVATDGGIFSFGSAAFYGSMGGTRLNRPVNGMVAAGGGYLMVADDGGVFTFGPGVHFHGSLGGTPIPWAVTAIEPVPAGASPQPLGPSPQFRHWYSPVAANRVWASWRPGCPVPLSDLYLVTVDHWDMFGRLRTGELVLHVDSVAKIVGVTSALHQSRFPIAHMELVDLWWGDDDASMAANNTSAFNCRAVTGGTSWSEHSYGRAIDVNPVQNPYVRGATVLPQAGRAHLARDGATPGLIVEGDPVVAAFDSIGWAWGGRWSSPKDYQHFSASGR